MRPYLARRLQYSLLVLWGVITVVFFLFHVLPADPARLTLGQRSDLSSLQNVRKELHLDQPLFKRYLLYLNDLSPISIYNNNAASIEQYHFQGLIPLPGQHILCLKQPYLGRSYRTKRLVSNVLSDALPGTITLALSAMTLATLIGILLGMWAALHKGSWVDSATIGLSVFGISLPSFFSALLLSFCFAYVLQPFTGLNMTGSLFEYDAFQGRHLVLKNLLLPAFALGIRPMAIITQLSRSALLDVLSQDYIRTAYAKGLSRTRVMFWHALPNALNPVITTVSGWLAELLAGSFFVEYIFGWKGIGRVTVDALDKFDFPLVMGCIIITALIFIVINIMTDFLYSITDPRISFQA